MKHPPLRKILRNYLIGLGIGSFALAGICVPTVLGYLAFGGEIGVLFGLIVSVPAVMLVVIRWDQP